MNINFHSISQGASFFTDNLLFNLSPQNKKIFASIAIIASLAFGFIMACFALIRCLTKPIEKSIDHIILYDGEIINGKINGNAKKIFTDGSMKGIFLNDELNGPGIITFHSPDNQVQEGIFQNSLLHGKGKITVFEEMNDEQLQDNPITLFVLEGDFEMGNCRSGTLTSKNGTIEQGEFEGFELKKGKITQKNGVIFEGEFHDDIYQGMLTYAYGLVITGCFDKDTKQLIDGLVEFAFADGKKYEGFLKDYEIKGKMTDEKGIEDEGVFTLFTNPNDLQWKILKNHDIDLNGLSHHES